MNHTLAVMYGVGVWAFVFLVAMVAFPLHTQDRALFESVVAVALALSTTFASVKYFQKTKKHTAMVGLCLGLIWLAVNALLDSLFFSWGPMKMSFANYTKDILVTYLMMPVITTGFGALLEKK